MFYELAPEVAGHLGPGTVLDKTRHPPIVQVLHYEFDGWEGDELIEAFPCFIVTETMRRRIESAEANGCQFGRVKVSRSEEFEELHKGRQLPPFVWLIVNGVAGQDDFGTSADGSLVVSERILQVMKAGRLDHCDVSAA